MDKSIEDEDKPAPFAYVPAKIRAHVIQVIQDDMREWDTTVVAFRIEPEFDAWPVPILMDGTNSEAGNMFVFVEDQDQWTQVGGMTCADLKAARLYVEGILRENAEFAAHFKELKERAER